MKKLKLFSLLMLLFVGVTSMWATNYYVKVTEEPTSWAGDYLIVNEEASRAFNGGLTTLDANKNFIAVTISDGKIASSATTDAAKFTIASMTGGYSVKAANGKYIGATTYSNSLAVQDAAIANSISLDASSNAVLGVTIGTDGTVTLRYNKASNTERYRYYKSGQQPVQLYKLAASTDPTVSLDPSTLNNLAATDVDGQEVTVTCSNFTNDISSVTAALYSNAACTEAYTVDPWVTDITVNDAKTKVSFKVDDNDGDARQAWLKVTASDGTDTESAILPISQKAAPLATMDAIYAAATAAGSTATDVTITFNNWVVSGVNGNTAYVTDGAKGFIIYKSSNGFAVNDKLNGTVAGSLKLFKGAAEEVSITSSTTGLTVTKDGVVTPVEKAISALSGVNTGAPIIVKKVRYDGTTLVDANSNEIKPFNTLYSGMSFTNGKLYNVTGIYLQFDDTKEILPRSAADIVEIPEPRVTVKNNAEEPETITSMAFGNVGQRWQQSFVFGFSYENLEAGDLTMTIGGTNASAFAFSGGELTETVNISSAGSGSVSSLSFRQATEVAGTYNATLTISGCGLLENVVLPITMTVKAPEFSVSPSAVHFGNVKQHVKTTETFTLTGKYLSGDYSVKISAYGAVFDVLAANETYYIWPDENKEINETVTVICDARNNVDPNNYESHLVLQSTSLVEEFADINDLINFDATVVATYPVRFQVNDNDRGTITINGEESDEGGKVTVYVVDNNEQITMEATPKLGWKFSEWQVANADKLANIIAIDDESSDDTYAYVSAEPEDYITAVFIKDCTPLARPSDAGYLTTTYNSANLKWQWVWEDENKAATYHLHAFETENPSVEIDKDLTFTEEEMASSTLYYTLTGLKGNTDYTVEVWGTSVAAGFCPTGEVAEITFTTSNYPAATLTLSENGVERAWGEDLKVASEVTLPAAPATNIVDKVFIGWITESSYSHATDAPANIKKAGEKYTVAAVADKLYAVYATATPGEVSTWTLGQADFEKVGTGSGYTPYNGSHTYSGISYTTNQVMNQSSKIQFQRNAGYMYNTTAFAKNIQSLSIDGISSNVSVYEGTSAISESQSTGALTLKDGNYTFSSGKKFFRIQMGDDTGKASSITVKYAGDPTYSNYVTSGPRLLALPTFDPEESETVYTEALEVEISAAEGTIHYTTDGTDPTSESPTYSSAITLNKYGVNTLKAIAIDGDNRSNIATANYTLDLPFASLEALVEANLPSNTDVTVSFSDVEITEIALGEIFLNVKGQDGAKNMSLFEGDNVPEGWTVGGKVSGTNIQCTLIDATPEYNWYLNLTNGWTGITYTKPASGLAWSAASATVKKGAKAAVNVFPTLTKPEDLTATITYSSTDETVATIAANGSITLLKAGETTIKALFENDAKYADAEVSYTLTVAPQGSVTVTPATLNYGKVKTGTASVNIDVLDFKISGENLTEGRAVSIAAPAGFSVTATQLWPPLSANYYITVNIDDATLNTAGVYDGNVVISSDDLEEDVIVAVKLTVEDAYAISVTSEGGWIEWNGSATAPESAFAGTEYTLEAKHDMSHEGGSIKVYKASDDSEVPEEVFDGTTLTMPAYAIKVVATFLLPAANISWESTEPLVLKQSQASNYSNWRILNNAGYSVTVTSSNTDVIAAMQPYSGSTTTTRWFPNGAVNVGTTTITATFAGNDNYRETSVSYEVTIENDVPTAIDEVNGETKAVKFIENNHIFIRRGEKVYTIDGALVK